MNHREEAANPTSARKAGSKTTTRPSRLETYQPRLDPAEWSFDSLTALQNQVEEAAAGYAVEKSRLRSLREEEKPLLGRPANDILELWPAEEEPQILGSWTQLCHAVEGAEAGLEYRRADLSRITQRLIAFISQYEPQSFAADYVAALELYLFRSFHDRRYRMTEGRSDPFIRFESELKQAFPDAQKDFLGVEYAQIIESYSHAFKSVGKAWSTYGAALNEVLERLRSVDAQPKAIIPASKLYSGGDTGIVESVNIPSSDELPKPEPAAPQKTRRPKSPRQIEIDGKVYVSLPTAAKLLHVTHVTMHNWAEKKVQLSNGKPINVVRDPMSRHRFISLEEVGLLAHRFTPDAPSENGLRGSLGKDVTASPTGETAPRRARGRPRGSGKGGV
jgi:hypothetical protein